MLIESVKQNATKNDKSYEKVKEEFEKTHSLIVNKSLFIKETEDDVIFMKECQLKISWHRVHG